MSNRLFSKKHLWIQQTEDIVIVGISDFLQDKLRTILFIDLPKSGETVSVGDSFGSLESVKTTVELESPVSGEIIEVNSIVEDEPCLINEEPYESWLIKVRADAISEELISEKAYEERVKQPWMQNSHESVLD